MNLLPPTTALIGFVVLTVGLVGLTNNIYAGLIGLGSLTITASIMAQLELWRKS